MQALLGRITRIEEEKAEGDSAAAEPGAEKRLKVEFKPYCLMPQRTALPEWLKDVSLSTKRAALLGDPREVGRQGDCIILSPGESQKWLQPLTVDPALTVGNALPETLSLTLRWWKDEEPPEVTVRANSRTIAQKWTKADDGTFTAKVSTASLFDSFLPAFPVRVEIASGPMKATATVVSSEETCFRAVPQGAPAEEVHRAENPYLTVEVSARAQAGAIASLRENGRGLNHFAGLPDRIEVPFFSGGHIDRLRVGWEQSQKMAETALAESGSRRQGQAARLSLSGPIEDDIKTSVAYTLLDDLPLLLLEREYQFSKGKDDREKKEKDGGEKPREPIDDVKTVAMNFRSATRVERSGDGRTGSRILCGDGERLVVLRAAQSGEYTHCDGWRLSDGWAMVEHPGRRAYLLYLFDGTDAPPHLAMWQGPDTLTLEPNWEMRPVRPGESVGVNLAVTAGEVGGAGASGVWVACRAPLPGGNGIRCAVIARLRESAIPAADIPTAAFQLGGETRVAALERMRVPGVGRVFAATAEFPAGTMQMPLDVTAAGIAARR